MEKSISNIGEEGLLSKIRNKFSAKNKDVIIGIGDDCAALAMSDNNYVSLLTTDTLLENIHFKRAFTDPKALAMKSVAINISDVSAMGGSATSFLLSLSLPKNLSIEYFDSFLEGIEGACSKYNVDLIGGNLSRSDSGIIICITMYGIADKDKLVKRSGASLNDRIFVTGTLGDSALGLKILKGEINCKNRAIAKVLIERHNLPEARVAEAFMLADKGIASAMTDLSDGLLAGLQILCNEGSVGARIYGNKLPISNEAKILSEDYNLDLDNEILRGGEDYEILFTAKPRDMKEIREANNSDYHEIGEIVEKERGIIVINNSGENLIQAFSCNFAHFH